MPGLINLLPDSKQVRLKAQRARRLAISAGTAVLITAVAVPVILVLIKQGQTIYLKRTQSQIDENKQSLKNTENITTMLTAKDHLDALPQQYEKRLLASKLLAYLPQVTPESVRLNNMKVDLSSSSITLIGTTTSYAEAEKLQRAMQRANVVLDENKVEPDPDKTGHFTNVVLDSVSGPSGQEVTFTIVSNFDFGLISHGEDHAQ